MSKRKTKEEWIYWFKKYENNNFVWKDYYSTINFNSKTTNRYHYKRDIYTKQTQTRYRFFYKYKQWKMLDNTFMSKKDHHKRTRQKKWKQERNKEIWIQNTHIY